MGVPGAPACLLPGHDGGRFGSALEFVSTAENGQLASAPVDTRLDLGPFAIEAWVYPTDKVGNQVIARKGNQAFRGFAFLNEFRILKRAISRAESALEYRRGFAALASVDGGQTWKLAAQHDSTAVEGQPGPAVLSASGFALSRTGNANRIEFAVGDVEGYFTSAALPVSVAPPDTTPLAFSDAEI